MASSFYGKYPIPESPDAANVPADLMELVEALDVHTVLFASSLSNRNALYNGIAAGAVVVCAAAKQVWISLGSNNWYSITQDTGWVTVGFTYPNADYTANTARVRSRNGTTEVAMSLVYAGATFTSNASGSISNLVIATIPVAYAPLVNVRFFTGSVNGGFVGMYVGPDGVIRVTSMQPLQLVPTGTAFSLSATWLEG